MQLWFKHTTLTRGGTFKQFFFEGVPYIRMTGTPYRFEPGRLGETLLSFDFSDADVNLHMSRSVGTFLLIICLADMAEERVVQLWCGH